MPSNSLLLRADALQIWQAGLAAVRSEKLMRDAVRVDGKSLIFGSGVDAEGEELLRIELNSVGRIAIVGAGKAGAGMAVALEEILGPELMQEKRVAGWVNVPADCLHPSPHPSPTRGAGVVGGTAGQASSGTQRLIPEAEGIYLHPARPAGVNEPTVEGVVGAEEILRIVGSLGAEDLCIALISGGGSALMPAPIEGITLADKLAVTRFLSAAGADIAELNTVRKQLSQIKGGGLARACRAGRLVALIISDIPGDPLELIASGPTVEDPSMPQDALRVLEKFDSQSSEVPEVVYSTLRRKGAKTGHQELIGCQVHNIVIGNNAMAVDAAGMEAEKLGYAHAMTCATKPEGAVEQIGEHLAEMAMMMRDSAGPNCLISGGEGTVKLAPAGQRGLGGRNQQTVLAAMARLMEADQSSAAGRGIAILSGGTDGEDGPTDAAGAVVDAAVIEEAGRRGMNVGDALRRNDAYRFFEPLGALVKTGPTHTNVCDLRVVVVERG